ncbi:AMP-binding protein [Variovorax boronicumulans]|uniref:AMP-binding protein n=1 Tax=Variovorax boronicumulans TaxID=436515 RepID=UPI001C57638F
MTPAWLDSYGDGVPHALPPLVDRSLIALYERAAAQFADRVALQEGERSLRYADWDRQSRSFAALLQSELNVLPGERVAMMCPNVLASPIGMIGILRTGAAQVNVNPMYSPAELAHQLKDADAGVIVVHRSALPTLLQVIASTAIRTVIVAADDPFETLGAALDEAPCTGVQVLDFADCLQRGARLPFAAPELAAQDLAFLQYTGGTTGLSKGAMLSHGNLLANIAQYRAFAGAAMSQDGETVITALPLYHIFALMVNTLSYLSVGATNVLVANARDMDGFVALLKRSPFTAITGVNTLFVGLMAHPAFDQIDFSRHRVSWGGGAPIPPSTSARWKRFTGAHIKLGYGLSETSPILTLNPVHIAHFTDTVGVPLPGTEISLRDAEGAQVPQGERGEIWARGAQVMAGYWRNPAATAEAFSADGFFKTGDIGVFDEHGFLRIVDRKKDMILVSGFNVYPAEVEAVAQAFDGVRECAVVAVDDERTGEAVKLYYAVLPGHRVDTAALQRHCRAHLAAYKVPRHLEQLAELPKSTVGKVLRRALRSDGDTRA